MATVTNADANRNVSSGNVTPQQTQQTTQPVASSSNMSTLQKYLNANKGSGQRLANAVGTTVSNEALGLKGNTENEVKQATDANTNFGQLNTKTADYTSNLNGGTTQVVTPTAKAYDVNQYSANLAGQNYAQTLAADENKLNEFRGVADAGQSAGTSLSTTAQKTKEQSEKEAQDALKASYKAYDTNKQRQQNVNNFSERGQLLEKALNTQNQRLGVKNLDNALLSQDRSGTLNQVNRNLQEQVSGLQADKTRTADIQNQIGGLTQTQLQNEKSLNDRLNAMQAERDSVLDQRVMDLNTAKQARVADLNTQYNTLRDENSATAEFANLLGLDTVGAANANAYNQPVDATDPYSGVRLFNTVRAPEYSALNKGLDVSLLEEAANDRSQVLNQSDINAYSDLAKLLGNQNVERQTSKFSGEQVGQQYLTDALKQRAEDFRTKDLIKSFEGSGVADEGITGSNGFWSQQDGLALGMSQANASLADILNNNSINRRTAALAQRGSARNIGNEVAGALNQSGYTAADLATNLNNDWGNEAGRTASRAEDQARTQVLNQANDYTNNIGYNNLLRILKGNTNG